MTTEKEPTIPAAARRHIIRALTMLLEATCHDDATDEWRDLAKEAVVDARAEHDRLRAEHQRVLAEAAAMRRALQGMFHRYRGDYPTSDHLLAQKALAPTAGSGWLSPEEAEKLRAEVETLRGSVAALRESATEQQEQTRRDMETDDARYRSLFWAVFNALKDAGAPKFRGSNEEELVEGVRRLAAEVRRAVEEEREAIKRVLKTGGFVDGQIAGAPWTERAIAAIDRDAEQRARGGKS